MSSNRKHHFSSQETPAVFESKVSPSPEPVEQMVLSELVEIRDQLKTQLCCLAERESALREREERMSQLESLLASTQDQLTGYIEQEVQRRIEGYCCDVERLEDSVQQKTKENQRLKNSFETVRLANKNLKQQLDDIRVQNEHLESQLTSMQGRLKNLQRKLEVGDKPKTVVTHGKTTGTQTSPWTMTPAPSHTCAVTTPLISLLMAVVTERFSTDITSSHPPFKKLLQLTCQLLPALSPSLELPCVQFLYTVLMQTTKQERSHLTSTLRRIGEQLYLPNAQGRFYRSSNVVVHTFSILVILTTTTQDVICEVLLKLKAALKENAHCRELFLGNLGVEQLVTLTQPINKVIVAHIVDIFLQLSVESALLPLFLRACVSEQWFSMATLLLSHHTSLELHTLEKLSILLQRLSKIKNCRRQFEGCKMSALLQKLLATEGLQAQAPFLALNLQSTLLNLTT